MAKRKLSEKEQKLLLAFKGLLNESLMSENTPLGDMLNKTLGDNESKETSHLSQFRWEGIDDEFKLKIAGSPYEDSITSAFFSTHNYKYLNNPTFSLTFEREMKQRGVPQNEIDRALKCVNDMVKELSENPNEQDAGWNRHIEDMVDITSNADNRTPDRSPPFTGGLYDESKYGRDAILENNNVLSQAAKLYDKALSKGQELSTKEENIIKQSPYFAYMYANNVLGHRWHDAEEVILTEPLVACEYAKDVINDRWPEAETSIIKNKDADAAYVYARDVMHERWPEAERVILHNKDADAAYGYAKDVMRKPWPEAEKFIKSYKEVYNKYKRDVLEL